MFYSTESFNYQLLQMKSAKKDNFIVKIKKQVTSAGNKHKKSTTENNTFSICDDIHFITKWILQDLHIGHSGMSRMKSLMRSFVYWLGMDYDRELLVKNSRGCVLAEKSPPIKFESWLKTDVSWKRLHIDFVRSLNGSYYFITVDSFLK